MTASLASERPRSRLAAAGLLFVIPSAAAVTLLSLSGNMIGPAALGLPDPGPLTRWGLPIASALRDLAAVVTIGSLVVVATVLAGRNGRSRQLSALQLRLLTVTTVSGSLWVWSAATEILLVYSDLVGAPPFSLEFRELVVFVTDIEIGRSLFASLAIAGAVTIGALMVRELTGAAVLAVLAIVAIWPLALTGHAAGAANHDVAVNVQYVHLTAAAVWLGGLFAILWVSRKLGTSMHVALGRYSRIAGWCFVAVAVSGTVAALLRIPEWAAVQSEYGALVGLKVLLFVVLGTAGWWQRRRLVARVAKGAGASATFRSLAVGELAIMAAAIGIGVALGRTPPPTGPGERLSTAQALIGYPMPPPLEASAWFTQWRLDTFWGSLAILAVVLYLIGVRRLNSRGDRWSWGRTTAWLIGCTGLLWSTSGAPGIYGSVLFSMHMIQHMTIAIAVPTFLVLGAPVTLALRSLRRRHDGSRGSREWLLLLVHSWLLRSLGHPLVAAAMYIAGLVVFYYSSLFELALRTHTGHVVMTGHFLFTGYLLANVVCGIDPGPRRPAFPQRALLLTVTFAFHAFFSIALMNSSTILAQDWFSAFDRTWGRTLEEDQYLGASLAWVLGDYPLAILAGGLVWRWLKHDQREARRFDRQAERDGDRALTEYNEYLRDLTRVAANRHDGPTQPRVRPGGAGTAQPGMLPASEDGTNGAER